MAIFGKPDPEAALRKAIDTERALRDQLRLQRTTAETLAGKHQKAAQTALRELADDKTLDAAERKQITAEHRVANLSVTLAEADAKIADLENQLVALLNEKQRAERDRAVEKVVIDLGDAAVDLDRALATMATLTEKNVPWCPDARGLAIFTASARTEIAAAVAMLQTILKSNSFAPEKVLAQPALPAAKPAPPPETMQLFAIKNISWSADRMTRLAKQWTDVDLPSEIAQRALRLKACVLVDNPVRREKSGWASKMTPRPEACTNLDSDEPTAPDPRVTQPEIHSGFQRVDRGPAIVMKVPAGNPLPASSSRSLGKEDK